MEAVQKSLEQVAKRAPGIHSTSTSAKAAATTPTVHDSIDRLIAQIEAAKAAISDPPSPDSHPNPAVLLAELKSSVELAQKSVLDRQKEFYAALSKSTKALDKKFPTPIDGIADPSLFSSPEAQTALERVILNHLQRNGDWSTSYKFAVEAQLPLSSETEGLYVQLHNVIAAMGRGDLRPAISWAEGERRWLEGRKSGLEFALHRSQFIRIAAGAILPGSEEAVGIRDPDGENVEMMSASFDQLHPASIMETTTASDGASADALATSTNVERALAYGRTHFKPFRSTHLVEIQRLFTLLAFLPAFVPASAYGPEGFDSVPVEHLIPTVPLIYQPLLDANLVHAPLLEPLFRLEFCSRNRIAKDAPLAIGVEVGAGGALNKIIKVKAVMKERGNEWSQADELPVSIFPPHSFSSESERLLLTARYDFIGRCENADRDSTANKIAIPLDLCVPRIEGARNGGEPADDARLRTCAVLGDAQPLSERQWTIQMSILPDRELPQPGGSGILLIMDRATCSKFLLSTFWIPEVGILFRPQTSVFSSLLVSFSHHIGPFFHHVVVPASPELFVFMPLALCIQSHYMFLP